MPILSRLQRLPPTPLARHRADPRRNWRKPGRSLARLIADDADVSELVEALGLLPSYGDARRLERIQENCPSSHNIQSVAICDGSGEFFDASDAITVDGSTYSRDYYDENFGTCDDCSDDVPNDELQEVGHGRHTSHVCESCRENYSCCNDCGEYTPDDSNTTVDGNTVCESCLQNGEYWFWESDSEYHSEPVTDEDEDDEDSNGLSGYHGTSRPSWWKNPAAHHGVSAKTPCFGVELELDCSDIPALLARVGDSLLAEEDGSLRSSTGVELIGGPYTLAQYQAGTTPWKNELFPSGCKGHNAHTNDTPYGIHVSISRASFASELHLSKFVVFLNIAEQLGKAVAQRTAIFNGKYKVRCKCGRKALDTTKYEPANVGTHRVEVRIFRSNLRQDRITKNVEYVAAVHEFTRDVSLANLADETIAASSFVAWLSNRPGDYPNLGEFLGGTAYRAPFVKWIANRKSPKNQGATA